MPTISSGKINNDKLVLYFDSVNYRSYGTNLLNYSHWQVGTGSVSATSSLYGVTGYDLNGDTTENVREFGLDPFGNNTVLWSARNNDVASNGDGGWNTSTYPIDNTKMYRFSVWVNREVLGNGSFYFGLYSNDSELNEVYLKTKLTGLTNSTTVNPYFAVGSGTSQYFAGLNTWSLVVGHLWPVGSATGSNHIDSGAYTIADGKISDLIVGVDRGDFIQVPESAYVRHRSYLYYSTDSTTVQKWCYPRIDLCDGTEPTIQELLTSPDPLKDLSKTGATNSSISNTGLSYDRGIKFNVFPTNNTTYPSSRYITSFTPQSQDATYEVWCRLDAYKNSYNMVFGTVLPYMSFHTSGRFLLSNRYDNFQCNLYSNTLWEIGKIYHVVYTHAFDGVDSNVNLYINGVLDKSAQFPGFYTETNPTINNFAIGDGRATSWYPFDGTIFSIKVYERELSAVEVLKNFQTHQSKYL